MNNEANVYRCYEGTINVSVSIQVHCWWILLNSDQKHFNLFLSWFIHCGKVYVEQSHLKIHEKYENNFPRAGFLRI